ncbi:Putative zinc-finger [Novosphingobium sp. CF614]|uniref:zf-HC2 domain-containing protein n=1 Tax=Novosphingobium sp. CF614 TaxID=1884364 RepID=UPI0008F035DA|nr:zf-HC2 domain-containing protein [Novosphingobium sp. CF614]SFF86597.1 Putative zinc-finger [Novosphingobium sp. CF614]
MNVTREELMAYADGELSGAEAARVEAAVAADPALAERLAAERRLREALQGHLDPVAEEPVPDALAAMIAAAREDDSRIVSMAAARAEREAKVVRRPFLPHWGSGLALAASLVLGLMLGTQLNSGGSIAERNGALVASGMLAKGLDTQLASAGDEGGPLRILTSFQRHDGDYCRVFEAAATSGIACKDNAGWVLERTMANGRRQASEYRQAGSAESDLMTAAQDMAQGAPLDADQEQAAKAKGWKK